MPTISTGSCGDPNRILWPIGFSSPKISIRRRLIHNHIGVCARVRRTVKQTSLQQGNAKHSKQSGARLLKSRDAAMPRGSYRLAINLEGIGGMPVPGGISPAEVIAAASTPGRLWTRSSSRSRNSAFLKSKSRRFGRGRFCFHSWLGHYYYGAMPVRYFMEFPSQSSITRCGLRRTRVSELAAHQGSGDAAGVGATRKSEPPVAAALPLQRPQRGVSTMYEDLGRADRMLERIWDFLRATLRLPDSPMVPVTTELELVRNIWT